MSNTKRSRIVEELPYFFEIALLDSLRARSILFSSAVVFAGIILLLLVLSGLKKGLVKKLHDDIMTSPTAITGTWQATIDGNSLDEELEDLLLAELPDGTKIIPKITKIISLASNDKQIDRVTLEASIPEDPMLTFYKAGFSGEVQIPDIVISPKIASTLGYDKDSFASLGDDRRRALIKIERGRGENKEAIHIECLIKAIVGEDVYDAKVVYMHRKVVDQINSFTAGKPVKSRGWPGTFAEENIGAPGFLSFCRTAYTGKDLFNLRQRGLQAVDVSSCPDIDTSKYARTLFGLLRPNNLHIYHVSPETPEKKSTNYVPYRTEEIESITDSDDVVYIWAFPRIEFINHFCHRIVGVSGSMRWMKEYFYDPATRFSANELSRNAFSITPLPETILYVNFEENGDLELSANLINQTYNASISDPTSSGSQLTDNPNIFYNEGELPTVFIPAKTLICITRFRQGDYSFDSKTQSFQNKETPNSYDEGKFVARKLTDVPLIDRILNDHGYSTRSSKTRVLEMQGYAETLDLLVNILQIIATLLGVLTTGILFSEITLRRQSTIGIMRIMGMKPFGVFLFIFLKAIIISFFGWLIAVFLAANFAYLLPIISGADCRIQYSDYVTTLLGTLVCAAIGITYPAWHAACKLAPIDAIRFGKVQ
jgi:ABC-type lipoprotein release transport system permease subunit